jgi:hypothetical protein
LHFALALGLDLLPVMLMGLVVQFLTMTLPVATHHLTRFTPITTKLTFAMLRYKHTVAGRTDPQR